MKAKRGRPRRGRELRSNVISLRIGRSLLRGIDENAKKVGSSRGALIRCALMDAWPIAAKADLAQMKEDMAQGKLF